MVGNSEWMSRIQNGTKISELSIPGAHHTVSRRDPSAPFCSNSAKCQNHMLLILLGYGVRVLDIRLIQRVRNELIAWHGNGELFWEGVYQGKTFGEIILDCKQFLEWYPREVIFMYLKGEAGGPIDDVVDEKIEKDVEDDKIKKNKSFWYLENSLPCELKESMRGKIVPLRRVPDSSAQKIHIGINLPRCLWGDDNPDFKIPISESSENIKTLRIQDKYEPRGNENDAQHNKRSDVYKMLVHSSKNTDQNTLHVNFTSGVYLKDYGFKKIPKTKLIADGVNPWVQQLFKSTSGLKSGFMMLDFVDKELASAIIEQNFSAQNPTIDKIDGYIKSDAVVFNSTSEMYYFFKGAKYWRKELGHHTIEGPFNINDDWKGIPEGIDCALYNYDSKTYYFFKGENYWTKKYQSDVTGPKSISSGWGDLPNNLDAGLYCSKSETYYFFKGESYWTKKYQSKVTGPKTISSGWDDLPNNLDAGLYNRDNGKYYFFKDDDCYFKKFGGGYSAEKSKTSTQFPRY